MTLYVIENDNGEVLDRTYYEFTNDVDRTMVFDEPIAPAEYAKKYGGHVVELVEKPEPVEVSEEEAEMLEHAKDDYCAASVISAYSAEHIGAMGQDRLMRAYVNGWTVEKPKRWYVKVPGEFHGGERHYWKTGVDRDVETAKLISTDSRFKFTDAEIEHYGLQDCEKVEVKE